MAFSSGVQNNLNDILRRKPTNSSTPVQTAPSKSAKFKPAAPGLPPNVSLRKQASVTLPSFSTPGFGKPKHNVSHPGPGLQEAISISSNSTPSPGIKRSSSDSYIAAEAQPSKRVKLKELTEKENHFRPDRESRMKDKGKSRSEPSRTNPEVEDDEPWTKMEIGEPNPFAMIDRDFPKFCHPPPQYVLPAEPVTKYPDLLSKSTEQLNNILLFNHEANRQNMEAICNYHSGEAKKEDIFTLEAIKSLLNNRISAINELVKYREETARSLHSSVSIAPTHPQARHHTPSYPTPRDKLQPTPPPTALTSTTTSYEATSYASSSTVREGSTVSTRDSTFISLTRFRAVMMRCGQTWSMLQWNVSVMPHLRCDLVSQRLNSVDRMQWNSSKTWDEFFG
ncbi:hypothetical protein B0H10DRAFT_346608 [Mycena sp. CBHHK59/15]|nr:hypothetical protein B0H10DRAFT_346608 [Mycena sp. CBHHK59/15]